MQQPESEVEEQPCSDPQQQGRNGGDFSIHPSIHSSLDPALQSSKSALELLKFVCSNEAQKCYCEGGLVFNSKEMIATACGCSSGG